MLSRKAVRKSYVFSYLLIDTAPQLVSWVTPSHTLLIIKTPACRLRLSVSNMLSRTVSLHKCAKAHMQLPNLSAVHRNCSCSSTGSSARSQSSSSGPSMEPQPQHLAGLSAGGIAMAVTAVLGAWSSTAAAVAAEAAAAGPDAIVPVDPASYVPGPVEVGWQIWFAAVVSTVPFIIGSYEFGKRILIQRGCQVCGGSGLVQRGRFQRKCPECGGFFPWISWQMFLSANGRPGNGGPLLQPRGQTSVFYTVPPPPDSTASQGQQSRSNEFQLPMTGSQQQSEDTEPLPVEQSLKAS